MSTGSGMGGRQCGYWVLGLQSPAWGVVLYQAHRVSQPEEVTRLVKKAFGLKPGVTSTNLKGVQSTFWAASKGFHWRCEKWRFWRFSCFVQLCESLHIFHHVDRSLCGISADSFVADEDPSFISCFFPSWVPICVAWVQTDESCTVCQLEGRAPAVSP